MESELNTQVGGNHYKGCSYQPVKFSTDLSLNFIQGNIVKYIARYKSKDGKQDLLKVLHYAQLGQELSPKNFVPMDIVDDAIDIYCSVNKLSTLVKCIIEGALYQNWIKVTSNTGKIIKQEYECHRG